MLYMSSCHATASCRDMSTCHDMSECQKLSRLNLDALAVPEALVHTMRILAISSTPLHPPQPQIRPERNQLRIYPREPHNPVRNAPRNTGDAPRASGIAKTSIFKKCFFKTTFPIKKQFLSKFHPFSITPIICTPQGRKPTSLSPKNALPRLNSDFFFQVFFSQNPIKSRNNS